MFKGQTMFVVVGTGFTKKENTWTTKIGSNNIKTFTYGKDPKFTFASSIIYSYLAHFLASALKIFL